MGDIQTSGLQRNIFMHISRHSFIKVMQFKFEI